MKSSNFLWVARAISALLLTIAISACATVHGTWYVQATGKSPTTNCVGREVGCLLLALNNASNSALTVTQIDVYASKRSPFSFSDSAKPIWRCHGLWHFDLSMVIVLELPSTKNSACRIPMDAVITAESGKKVQVWLNSALPSAIPDIWLDCPDAGVFTEGDSPNSVSCVEPYDSTKKVRKCFACAN